MGPFSAVCDCKRLVIETAHCRGAQAQGSTSRMNLGLGGVVVGGTGVESGTQRVR